MPSEKLLNQRTLDTNSSGLPVMMYHQLMTNIWILLLLCCVRLVQPASPPYIVRQPTDMSSFEGNTVVVSCDAIGDFPILFKWAKDGEDLNDFETNGKSHLLSRIQKDDAGSYRCLVNNYIGTVMSRVAQVSVVYTEEFTGNQRTELVAEREAKILTCNDIDSFPDPVITWTLDGIQIGNSPNKIMTLDNRLVLLDFKDTDVGPYRCEADNPLDTRPRVSSAVSVFYRVGGTDPPAPEIIVPPVDTVVNEGEAIAEFECIVNGRPLSDITITWRKDGDVLVTGGTELFKYRIIAPQESDQGTYECQADMRGRTERASATLTIYIPPEFFIAPDPITISSVGSVVDMPCQATGTPRPTVSWYRNSISIESMVEARYQFLLSGSLQIQNLFASDAGMYQCIVTNEIGEDIKDTWLQVQEIKPEITKAPNDTVVIEDSAVTLECKATGAPKPDFKWTKDGVVIATKDSTSDPSRITLNVGDLVFDHTITSDTSTYMCIADNGVGVANSTVSLGVFVRTMIVTRPQDTEVELGQTTIIDCVVQHDPLVAIEVKWYHDDDLIDTTASTRRNLLATGSLEIKNARPTDSGTYRCEVTSVAGGDSESATLIIIELPYAPRNVRGVISTSEARAIELTWVSNFDGNTPLLRYIIEQKEDDSSYREIESSLDPMLTHHVVDNVKPSRRYTFRVTAENRVGRGETSDPSNVVHLPEEPPDDPPQGVVSSASSTTSIIVEWQEPPTDSWNGPLRGYIVRFKLDGYASSPFSEEVIDDVRQTSLTLTDLITWTRYEIQVAAYNGAGVGAYSESVRVRTNEGVPSSPPQGVNAVAVNSTAIRFEWDAPHPQTINGINQGYKLHAWKPLMENSKREVIVPPDSIPGPMQGYITGLDKYTNYLTSVLCFTNPGDGPSSNPQSVDTHEDVPGPVGNLKFKDVLDTSCRVMWEPPASPNGGLTAFEIGWQELNRSQTYQSQELSPTEIEYVIRSLRAETTYSIYVWAYTSVGRGDISTATVSSGVPPEPPLSPENVAVSNVQARTVNLQFIPGFDGYTSISTWITEALVGDSQQWEVIYELSEPNANSYEVPGLIPYTDYQFRIIARNVVDQSDPSEPSRKIQTLQDVPSIAPKELTVRTYSETSLRVRWVPLLDSEWSGEPLGYHIFWKEAYVAMPETMYALDNPYLSEYILGNLEEWTEYSIRVRAYNERGEGPISTAAIERTSDTVPSAGPEDVVTLPTSSSTILVTWGLVPEKDRNGDILGYKILYQEMNSVEEMFLEVPGNTSSQGIIRGLRGYTDYSIKVLGYTRIGDGATSSAITDTTLEAVPGPPAGITFPTVSRTSVEITWEPPPEPNGIIEKYKVGYRQQQHPDEWEMEEEVGSFRRHRVDSLTPEVPYIFRVTAETRLGWGTPASAVVITTNNRTTPEAPSKPVVDRVESRQARISWNEGDNGNSPLRSYTIQVMKDSGQFLDHSTGINAGITSYIVDKLSPFTLYQFRIQAHNDVGTSPFSPNSNTISTTQDVPDGSPIIVEVKPVTTTSVTVRWQAPPEDTHNGPLLGHRILFRQLPDPGYMEQIVNDPDVDEYSIESLEKYHNYEIKLAAYNSEGIGPFSRPITVFVGEAIPSAPPTDVTAVGIGSATLKISWTPPSEDSQNGGLQGYKILYWITGDKSTEKIKTFAQTSNTVHLEGLFCWTQYSIQVKGFNAAGDGPLSDVVDNRTLEGAPGAISSVSFSKIRMTSLIVHWNEPERPCGPLQGYQVFYQLVKPINGEKATITVDLGGTALTYNVAKLGEKAQYTFRVMAKTYDYGPYKEANVTTGPQTGAPDPPSELKLTRGKANLILSWKRPANQGESYITSYLIEFLEDGRDEWELLTDKVGPDVVEYAISYGNLKAATSYRFRVTAENDQSISYPTAPSEPHNTPTTGGSIMPDSEFYQQWWFLVILALVGIIIVILVIATLCMLGRSRLYVEKKVHKRIQPDEQLSVEDGGFATFEMNTTQPPRRSNRPDPYNRHNSYTRPPPRPSPGSIIYSEEEESKHYEDVHRRDLTDVAESSSLTEKSDLQSHSESQSSEYSKPSEMESDLEDQFPEDPHSFVNHYASLPTTQSWRRQQKGPKAYSYTDSESSMNNGGSVMLNGLANMPAGSRVPVHGFSSFV